MSSSSRVVTSVTNRGGWFVAPPTNARTEPQDVCKRTIDQVAVFPELEIPVTAEMIAAGEANCPVVAQYRLKDIYRAMAAVAPLHCIDEAMEFADDELKRRNVDLEATNALALSKIADLEPRIVHLEAERDAWKFLYEQLAAQFAAFVSIDPDNKPPAKPEPKPFPAGALNPPSGDPRHIGERIPS